MSAIPAVFFGLRVLIVALQRKQCANRAQQQVDKASPKSRKKARKTPDFRTWGVRATNSCAVDHLDLRRGGAMPSWRSPSENVARWQTVTQGLNEPWRLPFTRSSFASNACADRIRQC
jgi:hypothetical protein